MLDRFAQFNQAHCNSNWQGLSLALRFNPPIIEGLLRLGRFLAAAIVSRGDPPPNAKVLFLAGTENNLRSAKLASECVPNSSIVTLHNLSRPDLAWFNFRIHYITGLWALATLPILLLLEKESHRRTALAARLDNFVLTFGWDWSLRRWLRKSGCECVVTTSALSVYQNLVVEAARKLSIPTVLISHAPVGRGQMHSLTDLVFLDGEFHRSCYPEGTRNLVVTGSPRGAATARNWSDRRKAQGVLIATNTLVTDLSVIGSIVEALRSKHGDIPIGIRPHPGDRARFYEHRALCASWECAFHSPELALHEETGQYRFLLAGFSGVLIDALLIGMQPLELDLPELAAAKSRAPSDYYGLEALGLIDDFDPSKGHLPVHREIDRSAVYALEQGADPDWDLAAILGAALQEAIGATDCERTAD